MRNLPPGGAVQPGVELKAPIKEDFANVAKLLLIFKRSHSASRRAREVSKKAGNHQNLTTVMMGKSNPVQLERCGCTRAPIFSQKLEKKNHVTKIGGCGAKFSHKLDPGAVVFA